MELGSSGFREVDSLCASSERPASDILRCVRLRCADLMRAASCLLLSLAQCMSERGVSYVCAAALV